MSMAKISYFQSFKISNAANLPGAPVMPPPGWKPAPHW